MKILHPDCVIPRSAGRGCLRKDKVPDLLAVVAFIFLAGLFLAHWQQSRAFKAEMASFRLEQHEIKAINENLNQRNVGDCEITREWYGFRCVDKQGKVYRVYL